MPISPWGGIAPPLSPAGVWGRVYPACSRTRALLTASPPRRTPESSSCAASAHPHTHTVPGPCSPGSHAYIILGAVPRHATAPSVPSLPVPRSSFSPPGCMPEQQHTWPLNRGALCNGAISHPAGTRNASAMPRPSAWSSATNGAPLAAHGDRHMPMAAGSNGIPLGPRSGQGCSDAGLTSMGAGHSRAPPSRLPRFLPPHLHPRLCSPEYLSLGWQLLHGPGLSPVWDTAVARDAPFSGQRCSCLPSAFPQPTLPTRLISPVPLPHHDSTAIFMWPPANHSGHHPV